MATTKNKKIRNTHCQVREDIKGKQQWKLRPVEDVLGLGRAILKRCPECWGRARVQAGGKTPTHYEHLEANAGCSHSSNFDGTQRLHPNPIA